jgi:hypothetical protein
VRASRRMKCQRTATHGRSSRLLESAVGFPSNTSSMIWPSRIRIPRLHHVRPAAPPAGRRLRRLSSTRAKSSRESAGGRLVQIRNSLLPSQVGTSASCANRAVNAVAYRLAASAVPGLPRGRVLFLQTIKHLLGWNPRAALDPSLNRVFQFRHFKVFPLLLLFQDQSPKKQLSGSRAVACDPRRHRSHLTAAAAAGNR